MPNYVFTEEQVKKLKHHAGLAAFISFLSTLLFIGIVLIAHREETFGDFFFGAFSLLVAGIMVYVLIRLIGCWLDTSAVCDEASKKLTNYELQWRAEAEAKVHEAEKVKIQRQTERLEEELKRAKAEQDLINLKAGRTPGEQLPQNIREVQEKVSRVAQYAEVENIVNEAKQKYPNQAELLDAILWNQRKRLMREE